MNKAMTLQERLEAGLKRAVEMKRGGNLEMLLVEEMADISAMFYEEALRRRQQAADEEADFSPSGLSALRRRGHARGGDQGANGADAGGKAAL
jgi:hypothetical protein